ncbi:ABC transporter ATP-binding protein [Halorubrum sp. 48-1-W]|uniref:ABC transporter ATP-binding protein n=1 Tax=Halorubrum sp. 48-1-W TaxID=2249761 RepID=UPI000DCEC2A7|nr:ABC transporter ATP-binding protein [Halorubrum sp. 48-1-W]RAW43869.1 ABC transporter ATP-binding protein [Halorubrum sp. 48-1-W]
MSILTIDDLRKEFGSLVAVDGANFEIEEGEFVSILGPSGSGKSTILRMIAGFENPSAGTITLSGEDITDQPPFERDTNMVFQHLALFPHLTVGENIEYGLKQRDVDKAERKESVEEMLEMVQLGGYADRDISELSGGEQQRVALARAIVNEPEVVLFDEPLASLDRKLRQHMQFELQRIQEETGITFLYVTHDQEIALSISDRMVILNDGVIEQIGSVEELYDSPTSEFVADFLGDLNSISARVSALTEDQVTFTARDLDFTYSRSELQIPGGISLQKDDQVDLCVRPYDTRVQREAVDGSITGTIQNRMYRGNETAYVVDTSWGEFLVIDEEQTTDIDIDTTVSMDWDGSNTFVYAVEGS